ncbi:MAG TPA: AraC family transcriptional regulator [Streptosporangiaceae bacterium]
MRRKLARGGADRLERSGGPPQDSIRFGTGAPGLERAEVYLSARGFGLHRHDTYAIGITTAGVQTFRYRGAHRICLPGQMHILHPDETHDGAAGTSDGFGYRILYLAPELVRWALVHGPLPFVAEPVQELIPLTRPVAALLDDIDEGISDLAQAEIITTIADALRSLSGQPSGSPAGIDIKAVGLVRDYLTEHAREQIPASTLEVVAGTDRFTIARHFRRAFGTSPDRYRTMRRVALARAAIERGLPLAQVAAEAGFADQSHMTRQFKRAYGLTPTHWAKVVAATGSPG